MSTWRVPYIRKSGICDDTGNSGNVHNVHKDRAYRKVRVSDVFYDNRYTVYFIPVLPVWTVPFRSKCWNVQYYWICWNMQTLHNDRTFWTVCDGDVFYDSRYTAHTDTVLPDWTGPYRRKSWICDDSGNSGNVRV